MSKVKTNTNNVLANIGRLNRKVCFYMSLPMNRNAIPIKLLNYNLYLHYENPSFAAHYFNDITPIFKFLSLEYFGISLNNIQDIIAASPLCVLNVKDSIYSHIKPIIVFDPLKLDNVCREHTNEKFIYFILSKLKSNDCFKILYADILRVLNDLPVNIYLLTENSRIFIDRLLLTSYDLYFLYCFNQYCINFGNFKNNSSKK